MTAIGLIKTLITYSDGSLDKRAGKILETTGMGQVNEMDNPIMKITESTNALNG